MRFEAVKKWWDKHTTFVFCAAIILGFIGYFYFCTHNVLAPDALHEGQIHIAGRWETSLGRWGLQIMDRLRGGLVSEWLIVIISIVILALVCVLIVKIFRIKKKFPAILICAVVMLAPQFAESAMFIYCFDSYCLAMLLAVLAVYLMRDCGKKFLKTRWGIALLCVVMVCSLYQAYLGVVLGLILALAIFDAVQSEKIRVNKILRELACRLVLVIVAVVLYYVLTKVLLGITGIQMASYKGANNSIWTIVGSAWSSILTAYKDFIRILFTGSSTTRNIVSLALLAMIVCYSIFGKKQEKVKRAVLVGFGIVLMPIFVNIMDIIAPGTTINWVTGAGLLVFYVLAIVIGSLLTIQVLYALFGVAVVVLARGFLLSNMNSFYAREDTYKNFYAVSSDILARAHSLKDYKREMKFCYNDIVRYKSRFLGASNGFIAKDNETWNNFEGMRDGTQNFYKRYLGTKVEFCNKDEYKKVINSETFKEMVNYPEEGSIKVIDGIVVVKFNNNVFKV